MLLLIGGYPASGKTTVTKKYTDQGYIRLNRDTEGGSVDDLLPKLDVLLASGKNVVMDNLYCTKESRAGALKVGKKYGQVNFILMGTTLEDAQFNACLRMMEKTGKILNPEDHKSNKDPNLFPVAVIYKYRKDYEKPSLAEGFDALQTEKFVREFPATWTNKAAIFDFDGTLRTHVGPEKFPVEPSQVRAIKKCAVKLKELEKDGYILLGVSNQSGVGKGTLTHENAKACFDETLRQLDVKFTEVCYCPHKVPPITCYCRKPGPSFGVYFMCKYNIDPRKSFYVGDLGTDKTFADRCGLGFHEADKFF